ncbi:zinc/manganese transport system substrate-binding protein [Variovorax paradoxus]|uniref:Zinc/manganese transport system substrate-binding protein n=1 Tax=Variovorax paradoxus TaxID=34073 RepID=A0AAW8EM49_VARPD|nr:metal ABC transporter substrate-binding protein [Variovorax paradoxus]MDP9972966.1 zinc/manganese transport system substrate-binding protein [Variovorax paradoxus]
MNFPSNPSRRRFFATSLIALPLPALAQSTAPRPLRIVASFSILADMAREIGGGAVEVVALVGPDSDAHVFQPSPADARRLANAELIVVNGLGFEGWMDRLVRSSGYRGAVAVASDGVPVRRMGRAPDPHAWQDLANAQRYAANLRDAMARARPAFAAVIGQRCASYIERLQALDREVRARFDAMPREHRRVISSHDAFGYFGAAYGIEFLAPQGMNTDSEASAASVARLIGQIRREDVRAVFVENISDPRLVQRIAREGGVIVGGRLYSDALSAPGTEAGTYLKLFAHNATTIASALSAKR